MSLSAQTVRPRNQGSFYNGNANVSRLSMSRARSPSLPISPRISCLPASFIINVVQLYLPVATVAAVAAQKDRRGRFGFRKEEGEEDRTR